MKIYPLKISKHIISNILSNYEYLGTSDTGELAFKEKTTNNFLILTFDYKYIYCEIKP